MRRSGEDAQLTSRHCTGHTRWPTGWSLEGGGTEHTQPSLRSADFTPKGWRCSHMILRVLMTVGLLRILPSSFNSRVLHLPKNTCLISEMLQ